jgi:hypothetical protein
MSWSSNPKAIYIEVDFRFLHKMCAVGTKGMNNKYVGPFFVEYSKDGTTYFYSSIFGSRVVSIDPDTHR